MWVRSKLKMCFFWVQPSRPSVVNFINFKHTNFSYNVRFGSFYYVHVTRKSCRNDIRTKKRSFYVDEIDTLWIILCKAMSIIKLLCKNSSCADTFTSGKSIRSAFPNRHVAIPPRTVSWKISKGLWKIKNK